MVATRHDIKVEQGAAFSLNVVARNTDGTIKNLTGYSARMHVRATVDSSTVLMEASSADGRITIDVPSGTVRVLVGADITAPMTWNSGVYDLEIFNGVSDVVRLVEGSASLSKEVTR